MYVCRAVSLRGPGQGAAFCVGARCSRAVGAGRALRGLRWPHGWARRGAGPRAAARASVASGIWTFWITLASPYLLAFFQVILFLRCLNVFLPPTRQFLIHQTDQKFCMQLTKAFFGCVYPYPSPPFFFSDSW